MKALILYPGCKNTLFVKNCTFAAQRRAAGVVDRGRLEICCPPAGGPGVRIPRSPQVGLNV